MTAVNLRSLESASSAWIRAHEALSRLAKQQAFADAEEGRWLLAALRSAAHVHLGFGSFGEYVERLFGYGRRCTQEKLRVAQALENLPMLARALTYGALTWSAVRELTRVAVSETEQTWIEVARGKTIRQLEELVAGKSLGDTPTSPSDLSKSRHVLRFEVAAETFAIFREALAELRRSAGSALGDDEALLEMARCVLAGPSDDGRASYQIALTLCAACKAGRQEANGDLVHVGTEIVDMACCDGQHIGNVEVPAANDVDVHPANDGGGRLTEADPERRESRAHVGASIRAKQDVPPAVRRAVLRRDHGRCRVPGCRNATFLDVHHIVPRAEGGLHHADNLLTVCCAHHRALHRGEIGVERNEREGNAGVEVCFRHADGTAYGETVQPRSIDFRAKLFGALRGLGFREGDVRRVIGELRGNGFDGRGTLAAMLKDAVQRLTPSTRA